MVYIDRIFILLLLNLLEFIFVIFLILKIYFIYTLIYSGYCFTIVIFFDRIFIWVVIFITRLMLVFVFIIGGEIYFIFCHLFYLLSQIINITCIRVFTIWHIICIFCIQKLDLFLITFGLSTLTLRCKQLWLRRYHSPNNTKNSIWTPLRINWYTIRFELNDSFAFFIFRRFYFTSNALTFIFFIAQLIVCYILRNQQLISGCQLNPIFGTLGLELILQIF